jgi:hypothetical protein
VFTPQQPQRAIGFVIRHSSKDRASYPMPLDAPEPCPYRIPSGKSPIRNFRHQWHGKANNELRSEPVLRLNIARKLIRRSDFESPWSIRRCRRCFAAP